MLEELFGSKKFFIVLEPRQAGELLGKGSQLLTLGGAPVVLNNHLGRGVIPLEPEFGVPHRVIGGIIVCLLGNPGGFVNNSLGQAGEPGIQHLNAGSRAGHDPPQQSQGRPVLHLARSLFGRIDRDQLLGKIKDLLEEKSVPRSEGVICLKGVT